MYVAGDDLKRLWSTVRTSNGWPLPGVLARAWASLAPSGELLAVVAEATDRAEDNRTVWRLCGLAGGALLCAGGETEQRRPSNEEQAVEKFYAYAVPLQAVKSVHVTSTRLASWSASTAEWSWTTAYRIFTESGEIDLPVGELTEDGCTHAENFVRVLQRLSNGLSGRESQPDDESESGISC